ncbi:conserved hypothetical protein [Neospora caninum Liverpool]|uniref:Transmembrane protein n=1 Tax=Neospora caninum (strain Liverpool) TaxID=572307 RepID=F0VQK1_NEOCL|nr:conserved hypothetical protein [Neospora caninum Liverpool]CBZ55998.1 conserved hypothetical protein [Neospora caninum Liverpool]CEL70744.1 TPA: hypothetical protein BN1204_064240 [Neospora caninum Liverpool]|eukprot:XP_003886024.1 conserved hypothetical protein [Neospora caninum Liverpool]
MAPVASSSFVLRSLRSRLTPVSHSFRVPLTSGLHRPSTPATQVPLCSHVFPVSSSSSAAFLRSSTVLTSSRFLPLFPVLSRPPVSSGSESPVLPRSFARSFAVRQRRHLEEKNSSGPPARRDPSSPAERGSQGPHNQSFPSGTEGLSLGWQLFIAFASSIFFYFGFVLVMRLFGGQRVAAIHVDQYGRPVDPNTGRPY